MPKFAWAFFLGTGISLSLAACAQMAAKQAVTSAVSCAKEVNASREGQIVYARIWANDETDTAAKLTDFKPLNDVEKNAFVQVHNRMQRCRQIIIAHDNQYAAWETPYWQDLFQKGDAVFYKLMSGEIPVAVANKSLIESVGQFQVAVSKAHADAVRLEEVQRQKAAEAMLAASAEAFAAYGRERYRQQPSSPAASPAPTYTPSCADGYACKGRVLHGDGQWH